MTPAVPRGLARAQRLWSPVPAASRCLQCGDERTGDRERKRPVVRGRARPRRTLSPASFCVLRLFPDLPAPPPRPTPRTPSALKAGELPWDQLFAFLVRQTTCLQRLRLFIWGFLLFLPLRGVFFCLLVLFVFLCLHELDEVAVPSGPSGLGAHRAQAGGRPGARPGARPQAQAPPTPSDPAEMGSGRWAAGRDGGPAAARSREGVRLPSSPTQSARLPVSPRLPCPSVTLWVPQELAPQAGAWSWGTGRLGALGRF